MPPKPHPLKVRLGRFPSPPDSRDYSLRLWASDNPLEQALASLLTSHAARATKDWAQIATPLILKGVPTPQPTPNPGSVVMWSDDESVLDQGDTGHCVGFSGADWGNTLPVDDHYGDDDGHALYYECKVIDGEPKQENGSTVRSLAKALKARGRLSAYAFASHVDEALAFVAQKGPVVFGTDWTRDMFNPDSEGLISPTGVVEGGHAYLCIGIDLEKDRVWFLNSWGKGWGINGRFCMRRADVEKLFNSQGEAMAAVELSS